jgi:hypothetical protein
MLLRNQLYAGIVDVAEYGVRAKHGDFESLISEDLFYRVQSIPEGRRGRRTCALPAGRVSSVAWLVVAADARLRGSAASARQPSRGSPSRSSRYADSSRERRLVAQICPRWNPLTRWMRQIEGFQRAV